MEYVLLVLVVVASFITVQSVPVKDVPHTLDNIDESKEPVRKLDSRSHGQSDLETAQFVYPVLSFGFPVYGYAGHYHRPHWHHHGYGGHGYHGFHGHHGYHGYHGYGGQFGPWGGHHGHFGGHGGYW